MKPRELAVACAVLLSLPAPGRCAEKSKGPDWVEKGSGGFMDNGRYILVGVGIAQWIRDRSLAAAAADLRACDEAGKELKTYTDVAEKMRRAMIKTEQRMSNEEVPVPNGTSLVSKITLKDPQVVSRWRDADGSEYSLCEVEGKGLQPEADGEAPKPVTVPTAVWGGPVAAVAFSRDGAKALSASHEAVALWQLPTGRLLWTRPANADFVAFSPDGKTAAAAAATGLTRAWETATGRGLELGGSELKLAVLVKDSVSTTSGGSSAESRQQVSHTAKNAVKTSAGSGGLGLSAECSEKDYMMSVTAGDMSSSKEEQAVSLEGEIAYSDPASRARYRRAVKASSASQGEAGTPAKEKIALTYDLVSANGERGAKIDDGQVQFYDGKTNATQGSPFAVPGLQAAALSPDGRFLLTGSDSGGEQLKLWESDGAKSLGAWKFDSAVTAVAFSPDGKTALVGLGSGEDNLKLLRLADKSIASLMAAKP